FSHSYDSDEVTSQGTGISREEKVLELIDNLQKQLPEDIDYEGTVKIFATDHSPLVVVLLQEIQRYNHLLGLIRNQLSDLNKGIQGLVVMSSELEQIFTSIFDGHVPEQWSKVIQHYTFFIILWCIILMFNYPQVDI
ncbi:unnamed protein product, partial [Trichobilharzia regenti]